MDPVTGAVRRFTDFFDVVIDVGMVLFVLSFWLYPTPADASDIRTFGVLMGFEFIMVHSGIAMLAASTLGSPGFIYATLVLFYGFFAVIFALAAGTSSIMLGYLLVVAWRMYAAFTHREESDILGGLLISIPKIFIYVVVIAVSMHGENLFPRLGLSREFVQANGLWNYFPFDMPHQAMAFAVLYFTAMALLDFWLAKGQRRAARQPE